MSGPGRAPEPRSFSPHHSQIPARRTQITKVHSSSRQHLAEDTPSARRNVGTPLEETMDHRSILYLLPAAVLAVATASCRGDVDQSDFVGMELTSAQLTASPTNILANDP